MKNIIILFIIAFSFISKSQTVTSTCIDPDSVTKKYKNDADRLTYKRVYHIHSTYKDSITLNKTISNNYLKALIAVYNATLLPAVDTVTRLYNIHTFNPVLNSFLIKADSNLLWMKNIRNNITPTGNNTVDSLIAKYYLKKDYYSTWVTPYATLTFKTDSNCNISALAKKFKTISGVIAADSSFYMIDGNNIVDSITTNYTWLVYSYGWGDCTSGCIYKRFWNFRVYNDCSVEYGGSYGAPLNVGIKEAFNSNANITVYPNPFNDIINFKLPNNFGDNITIKITDVLGQTIINNIYKNQNNISINLQNYAKGIYIYSVFVNDKSYKTGKLLKD